MKTIGLIGGMSWQSTIEYYRFINKLTGERIGIDHSAKIIINSVDFAKIGEFLGNKDATGLGLFLGDAAKSLESAGAGLFMIGANTMHFVAREVQSQVNIPMVHVVDAVVEELRRLGLTNVALLGTQFTMEHSFYKNKLAENGITTIVPEKEDREFIHRTIFTELFQAILVPASKERMLNIINGLKSKGAGAVILGCTELPLLISQEDCDIPALDTTFLHSKAAVDKAFEAI